MELASMLAGAPFSDRGAFASSVIGAFLRVYNDGLDDAARQDLYVYAAKVAGTRGRERKRARMCRRWAGRRDSWSMRWPAASSCEKAGVIAARVALSDTSPAGRRAAMAFLDELIAVHRKAPTSPAAVIPDHVPREWVAGWQEQEPWPAGPATHSDRRPGAPGSSHPGPDSVTTNPTSQGDSDETTR